MLWRNREGAVKERVELKPFPADDMRFSKKNNRKTNNTMEETIHHFFIIRCTANAAHKRGNGNTVCQDYTEEIVRDKARLPNQAGFRSVTAISDWDKRRVQLAS